MSFTLTSFVVLVVFYNWFFKFVGRVCAFVLGVGSRGLNQRYIFNFSSSLFVINNCIHFMFEKGLFYMIFLTWCLVILVVCGSYCVYNMGRLILLISSDVKIYLCPGCDYFCIRLLVTCFLYWRVYPWFLEWRNWLQRAVVFFTKMSFILQFIQYGTICYA